MGAKVFLSTSQLPRNSLRLCLLRMPSLRRLFKHPEKAAEATFDDLEAGLIPLSSDEVFFYVVKKNPYTLSSPIFADRFSTLPPPHNDVPPVVPSRPSDNP